MSAISCLKNRKLPKEFVSCISDILKEPYVRSLRKFTHHRITNRFCHSLNVAYYSWRWCKFLNLDCKKAARGAMLHDLYLYNRKEYIRNHGESFHNARHPRIAFINAARRFKLSRIEADCILCHMFPATPRAPRYAESVIVNIADKYCALFEFLGIMSCK